MTDQPIGVFDSGVGGISVLNALRAELPHENFVYFADTANAPYGERSEAYVADRTRAVAHQLIAQHRIKALVVACNTATAAAIQLLRADHPALPLIGVEPALKPAVAHSRTGHIAVLATRGTLASRKFESLQGQFAGQAVFHAVPCDGLASAIEAADDADALEALCATYIRAAGVFGTAPGEIDTLVLGCTHYPFAAAALRRHTGDAVRFIETGAPVAQQTRRRLATAGELATVGDGAVQWSSSGSPQALHTAAMRWLAARAGGESMAPVASAAVA